MSEVTVRTDSLVMAVAFAYEIGQLPIPGITAVGIIRAPDGSWPVTFVLDGPAAQRVRTFILKRATAVGTAKAPN